MMLTQLRRHFNQFFFQPVSPLPLAAFRIVFGLCVVATLLLLRPDWLDWFGVHAWLTSSTQSVLEPGVRINLFQMLPSSDTWILAFFWTFLAFAVLLTAGCFTRLSSIAVYVGLTSIQQRNLLIMHGGDTFLRVSSFFLMFAPAGAALSIDRIIRIRRGVEGAQPAPRSPWAQRMIQIELSLLYITSFWWKAKGHTWWDGTALYYITHLPEIQRFPIPAWTLKPLFLKLGSWLALGIELSIGTFIWVRPLRHPILLIGLCFHLCLEYALNIPMFQWDVLTAYVLFIDPGHLERFMRFIRARVNSRHLPAPVGDLSRT